MGVIIQPLVAVVHEIYPDSAIELFEHAVVRCACWPIETLEPFASPALVAVSGDATRLRASIEARQAELCDALYLEIPQIQSRDTRRVLLEARRRIHTSTAPWTGPLAMRDVTSMLTSSLKAQIADDELERTKNQELDGELARLYADELERERGALREVTGRPEFQRALAVANPDLAIRWERVIRDALARPDWKRVSNSRTARMEASIFFYLCRAAGRPTPGALWAGVARLRVGNGDVARRPSALTVIPAARQVLVSVNLEPFVRAMQQVRRQPRYRRRVRLAFSAYRDRDVWRFQAATDDKHAWRSIVPNEPGALLLAIFADGHSQNIDEVIERYVSTAGGAQADEDSLRSRLTDAAERFIEYGLLTSSVVFPPAAPDCWTALEEAGAHLVENDREEWATRATRIRAICDAFSKQIDAMHPCEIHHARLLVERELLSLYRWAGIDEALPPVLLVDVRPAFEVLATRALWTSIRAATVEVLSFYQSHGVAENLRRATMEAMLGDGAGLERPFLETVRMNGRALDLSRRGVEQGAARLVERLQREVVARQHQCYEKLMTHARDTPFVVAPASDCTSEPLAGFDGTLVFSVAVNGELRAEWGRPHALCLVSRFVPLLDAVDDGRASLTDEVEKWYASWTAHGFAAAEVTGTDVLNPNAGTRPRLGSCQLGAGDGETLTCLVVGASASGARPWLRTGTDGRRLLPVYNCTGRIGASDACSDVLYRLALGHGWEFTCRRLFPRDEARIHIPRLVLPGGVALSPARWFLGREQVEALLCLEGVHRYTAWLGHVRRLGLPERVRVATESGAEEPLLYMPVTSTLAVASLLAKIAARPRSLEFVEDHSGPHEWSIVDDHGAHYASEIVVGWRDASYLQRAFGDNPTGEAR